MTDLGMGGGKSRHREETLAWVGSSPNGQVHASQWATIHRKLPQCSWEASGVGVCKHSTTALTAGESP